MNNNEPGRKPRQPDRLKGEVKMFKDLVKMIVLVNSMEDFNVVSGTIDQMYDKGKINWKDHELLHDLLGKIRIA